MTGRLGSIYGHKNILLTGAAWWIVCLFINAFRQDYNLSNTARALSGISTAMIVANVVGAIGTTLPPGNMRSLSLGFFRGGDPRAWIVRRTVRDYRSALYLSMGMAAVALVICAFGVGMPEDTRQGRQGEDAPPICSGRMKELF